jgi:iron complex outermembrane recepter protein
MAFRTLLFACAALCAGPAYAQQSLPTPKAARAADQTVLGEVVVTARKIGERAQGVPLAITAVSGAQLKQQSVRSFLDIQGQIPSLFLQPAADDPQSMIITMRGRGQSDPTLGVDSAVGVYIDGLYVPRSIALEGAMVDLDRIEVLRGPQGTLYGVNTSAGAVSIFSKNPTQDYGGSIDVTGGNFGTWNVVGIGNVPISDSSALRFVIQRGGSDGYGENGLGQHFESQDSQYYRAKFRQDFGNNVEAVLSGHYEDNQSGGAAVKLIGLSPAGGGLPVGAGLAVETALYNRMTFPQAVTYLQNAVRQSATNFYDNTSTQPSSSGETKWDTSLNITAKLPGDMQFRSITGVQEFSRSVDFNGPLSVPFFTDILTAHDMYYSQEFQLLGSSPKFNWVAGAYAARETGSDVEVLTVLPIINPGTSNGPDATVNDTSLAAFVQGTWELLPDLRLTGGARYSYDAREANDDIFKTSTGGVVTCEIPAPGVVSTTVGASQCPREFSNTYSQPTWLISLDYKFAPDILGYAKVATGYRSGGENLGVSVEAEAFLPFKPETNVEYEAGIKSEWFNHRFRLNVAAYIDDYRNMQVVTGFAAPDGAVSSAVTNAATAKIQGIELESALVVGGGLTLTASWTLTDPRYEHFVDTFGNHDNEPFPVPRQMASFSAHYQAPTPFGAASAQLSYDWKSSTNLGPTSIIPSSVTQGAYGLLDARVGLHVDAWGADVAVFGRNITSTKYYSNAVVGDTGKGGFDFGYAGAPATFGLEITKSFGRL